MESIQNVGFSLHKLKIEILKRRERGLEWLPTIPLPAPGRSFHAVA